LWVINDQVSPKPSLFYSNVLLIDKSQLCWT